MSFFLYKHLFQVWKNHTEKNDNRLPKIVDRLLIIRNDDVRPKSVNHGLKNDNALYPHDAKTCASPP